jgi:hypothetical protein
MDMIAFKNTLGFNERFTSTPGWELETNGKNENFALYFGGKRGILVKI